MRLPLITSLLLALLSVSTQAQDYGHSTSYSIVRWDEDYSYLKDPARRKDFFDPIKYIPLGASPDWYVSFGGQVRDRFDYFNNNEFGAGKREDGFDLVRMLAHADVHLGPNLRAFLQLDSSLEYQRSGGPRVGDAEDIDFQQAFVDLTLPLAASDSDTSSNSLVFRVGRQELIYGAQRLVSPNDWRNTRIAFDGAKVSAYMPNDTLDVFLARPVVFRKTRLNGDDDKTYFGGIYNVTELPRVLPSARSKLELYLLSLSKAKSATVAVASNTYTVGTRFHTNPKPWDFDIEPDWQFGTLGSSQIGAWSVATEGGYTFSAAPFTPRLALGFDIASGSAKATRRFNQLFPPQYIYLGHIYVLGRENLIDLHPGVTFDLTRSITLSIDEHFFWRQNTHDAVYNLSGAVVRASGTSKAPYIGNEIDIAVNWQIQRHLSTYFGYAHFFTGPFLQATGSSEDQDFAYAAVTFTF